MTADAYLLIKMIEANVYNGSLSDADFRRFIRNSLPVVTKQQAQDFAEAAEVGSTGLFQDHDATVYALRSVPAGTILYVRVNSDGYVAKEPQ